MLSNRSSGKRVCISLLTLFKTLIVPRIHDYDAQGLYSNPLQFYDFLQNRVMIIFKPKYDEPDHDHPEFSLILSKKHNYDIVSIFERSERKCTGSFVRWLRKRVNTFDMTPSSYGLPRRMLAMVLPSLYLDDH